MINILVRLMRTQPKTLINKVKVILPVHQEERQQDLLDPTDHMEDILQQPRQLQLVVMVEDMVGPMVEALVVDILEAMVGDIVQAINFRMNEY